MPSLEWAEKWATETAQESKPTVIAYEERFGPLPNGLYKLSTMLTINTVRSLEAAMREALSVGIPITDWTPFRKSSRYAFGPTPSDSLPKAGD